MKKRNGTSKGRKYHSWWPPLFTAADEYSCKRCGLRIKQVQMNATLSVHFTTRNGGPLTLSRDSTAIVFYVKFKGVRRWVPRLPNQLVDCDPKALAKARLRVPQTFDDLLGMYLSE